MSATPITYGNPPSYEEAMGWIPSGSAELREDSIPILVPPPLNREVNKSSTYTAPIIVVCTICLISLTIIWLMSWIYRGMSGYE